MGKPLTLISFLFIAGTVAFPAWAQSRPLGFALGASDTGGSLRYVGIQRYALELKGQFFGDSEVFGLRLMKNLKTSHAWEPFFGLEADYISFDSDESSGSGAAGELFAGLEYFFWRRLSAQFDMGVAYVAIEEDRYSLSETGVDFIANFQLNLYFSPRRKL